MNFLSSKTSMNMMMDMSMMDMRFSCVKVCE